MLKMLVYAFAFVELCSRLSPTVGTVMLHSVPSQIFKAHGRFLELYQSGKSLKNL